MKIVCNNQPRKVIYGYELSNKERREFDYLSSEDLDTREFVRYKRCLYDTGEFVRVTNSVTNWDGYFSETFFSGVLIKYIDAETCIMASYFC